MHRPHVIMVDWSAAATPRPRRPSPDACWLAAGHDDHRPPPEYFRTRADCLRRLEALLDVPRPTLLGVDFSLGYPVGPRGPLLPSGRALCRLMARAIRDGPDNANNRFEVAAALNRRLARRARAPDARFFWGCPPSAASDHLTPTRSTPPPPQWRLVETSLRRAGHRPHSAWKLYTTGAVGSQTLLGLAALGRWLQSPALRDRIRLWPFDDGFRRPRRTRAVVIGEIWPSLLPLPAPGAGPLAIRDARQVVAARDAVLDLDDPWAPLARPRGLSRTDAARVQAEGWILGVPRVIHANDPDPRP